MDIKSTARLIQIKFATEVKSEEILIEWILNTYTLYLCMDKKNTR